MDWATFIVSETKALAWPGGVLAAIILLKRQISSLIAELGSRLKTAKGGGIELSFGARIDEVEKTLPASELAQLTAPPNAKRIGEITELSTLPPAYIISQAWLKIEEEIGRSISIPVMKSMQHIPTLPAQLLRTAVTQGFVTEDEVHTLNQLRKLRNQAAHSLNPGISLTDALRYNDIANSLVEQIKERAEAKRSGKDLS